MTFNVSLSTITGTTLTSAFAKDLSFRDFLTWCIARHKVDHAFYF